MRTYIQAVRDGETRDEYQKKMLQLLPCHMLADVLEEARTPILSSHSFFLMLRTHHPQTLRTLCHDSVVQVPVQLGDVIFSRGDACNRMLFVDRGILEYRIGERRTLREQTLGQLYWRGPCTVVGKRTAISEASLWLVWDNVGELSAASDSDLLALYTGEFARVIMLYEKALVHACQYAQKFFTLHSEHNLSDLLEEI